MDSREAEQPLLVSSSGKIQSTPARPLLKKRQWSPGQTALWVLAIVVTNILTFGLGYTLHSSVGVGDDHDYKSLTRRNISWDFSPSKEALQDKHHPLHYFSEDWNGTRDHHGIIAVDRSWAAQQRLGSTAPAPENPDKLVYQIDVFHALHCLYEIRSEFDEPHPSAGYHVGHCIEYIKHSLMCNADVTLSAMDQEHFLQAEASYAVHQCRDFGSLVRWFEANEWKGVAHWLTGFHKAHDHHSPK